MRLAVKELLRSVPDRLWRRLRRIYGSLPDNIKYGKAFTEGVALLKESEQWDVNRLVAYQEERLHVLVSHCYANVPYYRRIFKERGLSPDDIKTVEDLGKLPFLTRQIVRQEKENLIATNIPWYRRDPVHTAGSTGSPLDFFYDETTTPFNRALALRHLRWLGYAKGDTVARFRDPYGIDLEKLAERDLFGRELRLTLWRGDEKELQLVARELQLFRPAYISAWPSCLYLLARWLRRNSVRLDPPKYIVTSSENIYPHMREVIEETFQAPLSDWYGQEESVAIAMQCPEARNYHIQMEMGIVELLPWKDEYREIVGTCLHNMVMPFLRYRTGDLCKEGAGPCACGRHHPVLSEISGRDGDFIVTPDMRCISPLGLNHVVYHLDEIKESQIIQEDLDLLRVKVVPWKDVAPHALTALEDRVRSYLGGRDMRISLEVVEEIPRSATGKKPFVLSRLPVATVELRCGL